MPHDFLRRTILPRLARRVQVEGWEHVPPAGPYIIVANHQSYLDAVQLAFPLLVERNQDVWFLTTERVWRTFAKFGGRRFLRWLGMIPILNSQKAESLERASEVLQHRGVIAVFPEGKRNQPRVNPDWEKVLLKGKTGAARLALKTGIPVVPAGIIAPQGFTAGQAMKNYLQRKQPAIVRFGQPLQFSKTDMPAVTKDRLDQATKTMMLAIAKLCGKSYPF